MKETWIAAALLVTSCGGEVIVTDEQRVNSVVSGPLLVGTFAVTGVCQGGALQVLPPAELTALTVETTLACLDPTSCTSTPETYALASEGDPITETTFEGIVPLSGEVDEDGVFQLDVAWGGQPPDCDADGTMIAMVSNLWRHQGDRWCRSPEDCLPADLVAARLEELAEQP
jgi:hypothetical protein